MARVKQIRSAEDYPHELASPEAQEQLARVFTAYERFTRSWPALYGKGQEVTNSWAQLIHVPRFAELMLDLADFIVNEMPWAQRAKLRELAILTLYQRQRCDYGYRAHFGPASSAGITTEQIVELPAFRTSELFDDEEREVIEFTNAALDGEVSDELMSRLRARYGEQQTVELTVAVGFWALWGLLINVFQPDYVPFV